MTIKERYMKYRKDHPGVNPACALQWARNSVSQEVKLALLGKDHLFNRVRSELMLVDTGIAVSYNEHRCIVRVVVDEDSPANEMYKTIYDGSSRPNGWGREGMDDGQYVKGSWVIQFDDTRLDIIRHAPKGMSRQVKYEWATEIMHNKAIYADEVLDGDTIFVGVIVRCVDLEDIEASLWGIEDDGSAACREYIAEVIEELYEEVTSQIDKAQKVA